MTHLSTLVRTRQVTSRQLRDVLGVPQAHRPRLECVVTLIEEPALEQARRADEEIAQGIYRGPLHGIPWGERPAGDEGHQDDLGRDALQGPGHRHERYRRRTAGGGGAVLVAKLTMGALAWGDVVRRQDAQPLEHGGRVERLVGGFGRGDRCGAGWLHRNGNVRLHRVALDGVRRERAAPTFGRASRHGAMALCWTLDKIGPMCRSVEDCALVFDAIRGPDGYDPTVIDAPFDWPQRADFSKLRIGFVGTSSRRTARPRPWMKLPWRCCVGWARSWSRSSCPTTPSTLHRSSSGWRPRRPSTS